MSAGFLFGKEMIKYIVPSVIALSFFVASCRDTSLTRTLPNVAGASGEVLVVMDKELWNGSAGTALRGSLAPPLLSLPVPEPAFDLLNIPPRGFRDRFMLFRNVVFVSITPGDTVAVTSSRNRWSESQLVIRISAPDTLSFISALKEREERIRRLIEETEIERHTIWLEGSSAKEKSTLSSNGRSYEIMMPTGYRTDFRYDTVMIISSETPEATLSVIIALTPTPLNDEDYDTLKRLTDRLMETFIKGPDKKSYMTIEEEAVLTKRSLWRNNMRYDEIRGLWKLEGGFMGGPFITTACHDSLSGVTLTAIGFVYAPGEKKRELLRQTEALIYSISAER